ncbi:MAG: folylpolyglutamate synthase/dihydrofolate synthase family protein [Rhizobiaceae bacterium]
MSIEETSPLTAAQRIDELMKIHPRGFDLSLERIQDLLRKLGNPQDKLPPIIHFAGTNGKGSAIAFTRAILEAAGLSVHVDTSPHLVNWHERYRLGVKGGAGKLVEDEVLSDAIARVAEANGGQPITVYEVLTAVAFLLFSEWPADVCLIEVGLGGRFDSTNVMETTDISVITPVSIDHEAYLGDTLAKIAFEKAGIIKKDTPLVIGPQEDEALNVIIRQAARNRAATSISGQTFTAMRENGRLVYQDEYALLDMALPRLPGEHQISNAATAITTCRLFCQMHGIVLSDAMLDEGLQNADWPARMQHLTHGKLIDAMPETCDVWLDGGHNPGAGEMIAQFLSDLEERDPRPLTMVCGMLNTKDTSGYFRQFETLAERVITVPITSSDAGIDPETLADQAENAGLPAVAAPSLQRALQMIDGAQPNRVLICGSLYLAGDMLQQNETPPV